MILQLWDFSQEMWEHHNSILHDAQLEALQKIQAYPGDIDCSPAPAKKDQPSKQMTWVFR
jgi:hypothetical protein